MRDYILGRCVHKTIYSRYLVIRRLNLTVVIRNVITAELHS